MCKEFFNFDLKSLIIIMLRYKFIPRYAFKTSVAPLESLVEPSKKRWIGGWLIACAVGTFSMILVGGYTRLTHSGLSIVDWSPYTKTYPRTPEAWNVEFDKYKNSVEYQTVNRRMDVEQFKTIYTVEYAHRKIGVYLGYLFFFPFLGFTLKGYIKPRLRNRLLMLLGLGALQGGIGYWMVKSGIKEKAEYQNRPRVSPYRLSLHLMMATFIYTGLVWNSFAVLLTLPSCSADAMPQTKRVRLIALIMIKCLFFNIFTGALVAGIDAGKVYNTWPLMNGQVVPDEITDKAIEPRSFFENKALVQFNHRNMAYITWSLSLYLFYNLYKHRGVLPRQVSLAGFLVFVLINYQAFSGIVTLLNLVPPERANLHQMTAILTLSGALYMAYVSKAMLPV